MLWQCKPSRHDYSRGIRAEAETVHAHVSLTVADALYACVCHRKKEGLEQNTLAMQAKQAQLQQDALLLVLQL